MNTCQFCGAAFVPRPKAYRQVYCSNRCRQHARAARVGWNTKSELLERLAVTGKQRKCLVCERTFVVQNTPRGVIQKFCSIACSTKYHHRATGRKRALKSKYGITLDDYARMFAAQNGRCAICNTPPERGTNLHVDHDHKTGRVRGLLCSRCNLNLGRVEKNGSVIDYLKREKGLGL
jgi:hypothetical protein